jgi:hypothetical protein
MKERTQEMPRIPYWKGNPGDRHEERGRKYWTYCG